MNQSAEYHKIVPCPSKPSSLPNDIHWLSGEGCGSWFYIENKNLEFIISRYSPEGKPECKGIFKQESGNPVNLNEEIKFTYLSHCAEVNIIQNNSTLKFKLLKKC